MNIIVDVETLGLRENAVLLSMGLTAFNIEDKPDIKKLLKNSYLIKFDYRLLKADPAYSVDKDTVKWWQNQDKEVISAAFKKTDKDVTPQKAIKLINRFLELKDYRFKEDYVWARGLAFDMPKIEFLYRHNGEQCPLNSFRYRDIRTYVDILGGVDTGSVDIKDELYNKLKKHNPMNDTVRDAFMMQTLYSEFVGEYDEG